MGLFEGLSKVIEEKGLRGVASAGRWQLLSYWLNGWPKKAPVGFLDAVFLNAGARVYHAEFTPETYPALLGALVWAIDEVRRQGAADWQLHATASAEDWAEGGCGELPDELTVLKKYLADLCGADAAGRVYLYLDGTAPEEDKNLCKLLISNL